VYLERPPLFQNMCSPDQMAVDTIASATAGDARATVPPADAGSSVRSSNGGESLVSALQNLDVSSSPIRNAMGSQAG
jgi:hypothetical protein